MCVKTWPVFIKLSVIVCAISPLCPPHQTRSCTRLHQTLLYIVVHHETLLPGLQAATWVSQHCVVLITSLHGICSIALVRVFTAPAQEGSDHLLLAFFPFSFAFPPNSCSLISLILCASNSFPSHLTRMSGRASISASAPPVVDLMGRCRSGWRPTGRAFRACTKSG